MINGSLGNVEANCLVVFLDLNFNCLPFIRAVNSVAIRRVLDSHPLLSSGFFM